MKNNAFLLLFAVVLTACRQEYIKNKLTIDRITCMQMDTVHHFAIIALSVSYYSDSSYMGIEGSQEKGQHGSVDSIVFFGIPGSTGTDNANTIAHTSVKADLHTTFGKFTRGFNAHERDYTGQRLDSDYIRRAFALTLKKCSEKEVIMVLYRAKSRSLDTLHAPLCALK